MVRSGLDHTSKHFDLSIVEKSNQENREEITIAEAITHLREPIATALDRGHSLAEVTEMSTEQEIEIDQGLRIDRIAIL